MIRRIGTLRKKRTVRRKRMTNLRRRGKNMRREKKTGKTKTGLVGTLKSIVREEGYVVIK